MQDPRLLNDYGLPLFDRYDMSVEFERCMVRVRQRLLRGWTHYGKLSDAEIVNEFGEPEIYPLELFEEQATLEHVEGRLFEYAVPYHGDDEFWHLYPVEVMWGMLGEVFRGELLLRILAESDGEARGIAHSRLRGISQIIRQQKQRIDVFDDAQTLLVSSELIKIRRAPPELIVDGSLAPTEKDDDIIEVLAELVVEGKLFAVHEVNPETGEPRTRYHSTRHKPKTDWNT